MTERTGEPVLAARVEQRVVDREGGDCLRASIASITGLADVPNVAGAAEWFEPLDAWLRLRGWSMTTHPGSKPPAGFAVGVCPSPTFAGVTHAVVVRDGEVEWDPSPRRDDLGRSYGPWKFFLRLARVVSHPPVQPDRSGLDELLDAAREVVRFYGTDRTWSLTYRTLLGSRIDDLEAALAATTAPTAEADKDWKPVDPAEREYWQADTEGSDRT